MVYKNLNPRFDDVLYFPLRVVKVTPDMLASRGPILLQVNSSALIDGVYCSLAELAPVFVAVSFAYWRDAYSSVRRFLTAMMLEMTFWVQQNFVRSWLLLFFMEFYDHEFL